MRLKVKVPLKQSREGLKNAKQSIDNHQGLSEDDSSLFKSKANTSILVRITEFRGTANKYNTTWKFQDKVIWQQTKYLDFWYRQMRMLKFIGKEFTPVWKDTKFEDMIEVDG